MLKRILVSHFAEGEKIPHHMEWMTEEEAPEFLWAQAVAKATEGQEEVEVEFFC
jgi:hypothetical protein